MSAKPTPTCPHCGYAMTTDDMASFDEVNLFEIAPFEDVVGVDCPSCDKPYWVKGGFTPSYVSAFTEDQVMEIEP